uniref:Palmitoyltransferase n=1 Tax=Timema tahoe TaxID=61484 RepID=A0A7R9IDF9_9NEOP|nr:unnamed protein product [Timema tahoe]
MHDGLIPTLLLVVAALLNSKPIKDAVKWVPVLFIVTIVVWSYYAYVIQLCFLTVSSNVERVSYLLGYHVLFMVFCWAYWQTIFTQIGRVPAQFKMPKIDIDKLEQAETEDAQKQILERFAQNLPVTNRTVQGGIRYCDKCQHVKPDRAHHCSVCGECVLKMDHHCPWVNNCVAFTNYKFFILFLGYALLYCVFIAATTLPYFVRFWKVGSELSGIGRFHILFLFFVAVMFGVSLISLFCYHCYLVAKNRSTLEAFRAPIFRMGADKDGFSLGKYNNFQEVFGDNRRTWFLPVFSSLVGKYLVRGTGIDNRVLMLCIALCSSLGDGVAFPVHAQHQPSSQYNSMGSTSTHASLGDGVTFPQRCVDEDTDSLLGTRQRWAEEAELDSPPFPSQHHTEPSSSYCPHSRALLQLLSSLESPPPAIVLTREPSSSYCPHSRALLQLLSSLESPPPAIVLTREPSSSYCPHSRALLQLLSSLESPPPAIVLTREPSSSYCPHSRALLQLLSSLESPPPAIVLTREPSSSYCPHSRALLQLLSSLESPPPAIVLTREPSSSYCPHSRALLQLLSSLESPPPAIVLTREPSSSYCPHSRALLQLLSSLESPPPAIVLTREPSSSLTLNKQLLCIVSMKHFIVIMSDPSDSGARAVLCLKETSH